MSYLLIFLGHFDSPYEQHPSSSFMRKTVTSRIIILFVALLPVTWQASAQKKAIPGYIITLQKDTLAGKVVDQGDFANSQSVQFLDDQTGQVRVYSPEEIKGYGIEPDQFYVAQDLTASAVSKKLFSRQIVKGYTNLYVALPKAGSPVYVLQKDGGDLLPLDQKHFFGLLNYTLSDCPTIKFDRNAQRTSSYSEAALRKLISRYNQCIRPQSDQKSHRRKFRLNYGVMAGIAVNHYVYTFGSDLFPARGDYGTKGAILPGIFFGVPVGRKFELEWQVLYGQYRGSYTKHYPNVGARPFQFAFSYLNAPLLGRYYFRDRIFLNTGVNFNVRLHQTGSQTFMGRTEKFEGYPTRLSIGAVLGAGFKLRVLSRVSLVEGRMYSSRILNGVTQMASFNSYQILLRMNLNQ